MKFGLVIAVCAFVILDKKNLKVLEELKINNGCDLSAYYLDEKYSISTHEFTYIEKCNAILFIASYKFDFEQEQGKKNIFKVWDKITDGRASKHSEHITILSGIDALWYLSETSAGLHSVVTGDSQVYSQIRLPLRRSARKLGEFSPFRMFFHELSNMHKILTRRTNLYKGYTSLERLATLRLDKCTHNASPVVVVGLGRSGQLITKILSTELNFFVFVTSRWMSDAKKIAAKYGAQTINFHSLEYLEIANSVIFAIQNNSSTEVYAEKIIRRLAEIRKQPHTIIDMASPSIFLERPKHSEFISIKDLSADAHSIIEQRNEEATSASHIIRDMIPHIVKNINNAHKLFINGQDHA